MTDTGRVVLDAKAWQEGFAGGRRGLTGNANPYSPGSDAALAWQSGMIEGHTTRLQDRP